MRPARRRCGRAISVLASSLLLICSARIDSARRIGSPEFTMVANCREKTAISFSFTFARLDVDLEVEALLLLADLERGVAHLAEALEDQALVVGDQRAGDEVPGLVADLVLIGLRHSRLPTSCRPWPWLPRRPCRSAATPPPPTRRWSSSGSWHRSNAIGLADPPGLHMRGDRHVHRLHAEPPARLHRGVDLVHLALTDQVADGRRRHEHLGRDDPALPVLRSGAAAGSRRPAAWSPAAPAPAAAGAAGTRR